MIINLIMLYLCIGIGVTLFVFCMRGTNGETVVDRLKEENPQTSKVTMYVVLTSFIIVWPMFLHFSIHMNDSHE